MAVGGEAIARQSSGRVVFVSDAAPDETVLATLTDEKKSFARARLVEVLDASPDRVEPPCPHVAGGCGGCDWQHLHVDAQHRLRMAQVTEVLSRQGGLVDPVVRSGRPIPAEGVRTSVRGTADGDGHFSFRRRRSHDLVPVDSCLVAHPLIEEIIAEGRFGEACDITIRVGARTGDRLVIVGPSAAGVRVPPGVLVVGADELRAGRRAWLHEEVAGRRWRVSADSFFQASPEGAEALIDAVAAHVDEATPDAERLVDLCCGVGLFAGTVGEGRLVVGVERSRSAVTDAKQNLADGDVRLVRSALERWRASPTDVVVADPARAGLGRSGVGAVASTGARGCVLVSCDPASLGRDTELLGAAGYTHLGSTVLDLFGHTGQTEVVSGFLLTAETDRTAVNDRP